MHFFPGGISWRICQFHLAFLLRAFEAVVLQVRDLLQFYARYMCVLPIKLIANPTGRREKVY